MILGVDFSHWQGKPDCQKLKDGGVQFAFVKAGEMTSSGAAFYDEQHDRNIRELKRVGILCGDYYYFHPSRGASKQARHYAQIYNSTKPDLPPVVDIEDSNGYLPRDVCSNVFAFIAGIEEKIGITPIVYSRNGFIVNQIGDPNWHEDILFWIARYSTKIGDLSLKIRQKTVIWQYTDKLKLPGLTPMDGNYWLVSAEELNALANIKPVPAEPSEPTVPPEESTPPVIPLPTEPSLPPEIPVPPETPAPPSPSIPPEVPVPPAPPEPVPPPVIPEPAEPPVAPELPEPSVPAEPVKPSDYPETPVPSEPIESSRIWLIFYQFLRKIIARILSAWK
jgi:GH25 family lysozyme M1 (1,4-beta-N-acetylmuramidase)